MKYFSGPAHAFNQLMSTVRHSFSLDRHGGHRPDSGYRSLVEHLRPVVFEIDAGGSWSFLNTSWRHLSGYPVEESLGTSYLKYVHPKDQDNCRQFFERLAGRSDQAHSIVVRFLTRGGTVRWTEMYGNPAPHPAGGIAGILNVITDRVHEEGLLLANHRSLTGLINDLSGMVYRCRNNRDWTMEYVSRGSVELTGYDPEDIINSRALAYGSLIHPDDREQVWQKVQHALREETEFELEYRIRTAGNIDKWVWERGRGVFSSSGEPLGIEGFITDITDRKRNEERLRVNALYDSVTGLRTPPLFMDYLQHATESRVSADRDFQFALLIIHIDGLSDSLSAFEPGAATHAVREIAERLKQILTPLDILTRVRNDRYLALLPRVRHIRQVTVLGGRLQTQLAPPIDIGTSQLYVTASIGIAISKSRHHDHRDILRDAEAALERAIALGGARQEVSDLRLHARAAAASHMEGDLQKALEDGELRVYWQPVITLQDSRFSGLEARIAWPHPRRGLLFADEFVPMVEGTPIIESLWEWMLQEVCRQMRAWRQDGGFGPASRSGINIQISGQSLLDADIISRFAEDLLQSKPRSSELVLGISEHALLRTPRAVAEISRRLRANNICLILDDFGSARSSLTLLKNISIDLLRLDCSRFANDPKDARFAGAIVSFAHAMGVRVIADGVVSGEMLATVRSAGCDYAQGDIVSPPLEADRLWAAVNSETRATGDP